jgi:hypothetical protein
MIERRLGVFEHSEPIWHCCPAAVSHGVGELDVGQELEVWRGANVISYSEDPEKVPTTLVIPSLRLSEYDLLVRKRRSQNGR